MIQVNHPKIIMLASVALIVVALGVVIPVEVMKHRSILYTDGLPQCSYSLVESIPENITYNGSLPFATLSTFQAWKKLLALAENEVTTTAFYWSLRQNDTANQTWDVKYGQQIFDDLAALKGRNISLRIAQNNYSSDPEMMTDGHYLIDNDLADIRTLTFPRWFGSGVLHTKLWIVDHKHFYIGSANMDWRSITEVKELGIIGFNCPSIAEDVQKLFEVYWQMGAPNAEIPSTWNNSLSTRFNHSNPMGVSFNDSAIQYAFTSSSPPQFCPEGRESDVIAILDVINDAKLFIHIAVMDYFPTSLYQHPRKYWPVIDDALRSAAFNRGIDVKILISHWPHTWSDMDDFLRSLTAMNKALMHDNSKGSIEVKAFTVPSMTPQEKEIPFARVNHNKYMVTDMTAYIGTSNWSKDYFTSTGGIALVVKRSENNGKSMADQLNSIFMRDWNSTYASFL